MESLLIKNWIYLLTQNMLGSCCTYWKMSNIVGIKLLIKIIFGSYFIIGDTTMFSGQTKLKKGAGFWNH